MSSDDNDDSTPLQTAEPELNQMLGMFDAPAFARRGLDVEQALERLRQRCQHERDERLDMVRLRLRQWAEAVEGPESWRSGFASPIGPLWVLTGVDPPEWAVRLASPRRRQALARELTSSVSRFNRRWDQYLSGLNLSILNGLIDHYNRYYVLEKECVLGSSRLAAHHFAPRPFVTARSLLDEFPLLPVPEPSA